MDTERYREEGWWLQRICPVISGSSIFTKCVGSRCTHWEQTAIHRPVEGNDIKVGECIYGTK